MHASLNCSGALAAIALAATCGVTTNLAIGQDVHPNAALIVEGRVENVFQADSEFLVQILVQAADAPRLSVAGGARYPAPGEFVYAHVDLANDRGGRRGASTLPRPGERIRAFLAIGRAGRWESDGQDWLQEKFVERDGGPADRPRIGRGAEELGVSTELVSLGSDTGLKVVRVVPNSPAANAGIEAGDILVQANRLALKSEAQLGDAYRNSRDAFELTVRDIRSGREVRVEVEASPRGAAPPRTERPLTTNWLGVTTELAFYGGEAAVKVTEVQAGSPAERAGIKAGLLILESNGKPVSSPQVLGESQRTSRGKLELKVVDPSDRRERLIQVAL